MSSLSLPDQLPLLRLGAPPNAQLPRRSRAAKAFWLTWLVMAGAVAANLFMRPSPEAVGFAAFLQAKQSPIPDWVFWAQTGLLGVAYFMVVGGAFFGRRFPLAAMLVTGALAAISFLQESPGAWPWLIAALLLLVVAADGARQRLGQLRVLGGDGAGTAWLTPGERPAGWEYLRPKGFPWKGLAYATLAITLCRVLLAGPYKDELLVPRLASEGAGFLFRDLMLPAICAGLLVWVLAILGWAWGRLVESRHGFVLLDLIDTAPEEYFNVVPVGASALPAAEAMAHPECLCAAGQDNAPADSAAGFIEADEECPVHGYERLNAMPARDFLAVAGNAWAYEEEYTPARAAGRGARAPGRYLFHIGSMRGLSLPARGTTGHPEPGRHLAERFGRPGTASEQVPDSLRDTLADLDDGDLIDVIDLRPIGLQATAVRTDGMMPMFFHEIHVP